ncbi:lysophospholipase L1-like esterase [Actinopolyspora biskrensis]|uniref:Lysophospholipase L1-like esterase n=1 Tax=Actinopolyspora biskrensis TaxID=1470178 RepID=A0A852YUU8_9ACTN|nr:SGNH/GDSL hydrolase family protein [Actinopolyspora biskrensis]NYH77768.1 lysophospholipase L1-like esterase [Actinopolyspora biskrensis]
MARAREPRSTRGHRSSILRAGRCTERPNEDLAETSPPRRGGRFSRPLRAVLGLGAALALALPLLPGAAAAGEDHHGHRPEWTASWAASPVRGSEVPGFECPAGGGLRGQTVRNVVFLSTGGPGVRIRLTNAFGQDPLRVGRATVAVQGSGARAVEGTMRALTFDGREHTTVPAGEEVFSDPVALDVEALSTLLVSVYYPGSTGPLTQHPFTAQTNYVAQGNRSHEPTGGHYGTTTCWMGVSGVDVAAEPRSGGAVVAFGDSITDGVDTTVDANHRWPDYLSRRLRAAEGGTGLSVVNAGISGNRLLAERPGKPYSGAAGLDRLERDAFGQSGAGTVILLEGINDISDDATAAQLIDGYEQLVRRAHRNGMRVLGGTLTQFKGSVVWTPERERTRQRVNEWIRGTELFDGVVDFAAATAHPEAPLRLRPEYDSGDGLHPNDAGSRAMAAAVELSALHQRN